MSVYYLVLAVFLVFMALVPYNSGQQYIDDDSDIEVVRCRNGYVQDRGCETGTELNIIIAATLNGAVTALDGDTGEMLWRYQGEPLLQGSLTTSEPIDIGGTSLQLMPTLDGRLYSYTHNTNLIEPMAITTDSLLESTMRLGQDAVAGGKSVTTKGFDLYTGEVKYECSMESCGNQDAELPENPVLLVKRVTNSIRAMDTMRGVERWNLSTAEIDVSLAGGMSVPAIPATDVKVLLQPPDGILVAVNKHNREEWKTDVHGHIVSVWQISGNTIGEISMFDPRNIFTTQFEVMHRDQHNMQSHTSLLYMGTHNQFPFIIQSPKAKKNLKKKMSMLQEPSGVAEFAGPRFCSANDDSRSLAYNIEHETLKTVLRQAFQTSQSKAIEDKSPSAARPKDLQILAQDADKPAQQLGTENMRSTSLSQSGDYGYLVLDTPAPKTFKLPSPVTAVQSVLRYVFNPTTMLGLFTSFVGMAISTFYWIRRPSRLMISPRSSSDSSVSENMTPSNRTATSSEDRIVRISDDASDMSGSAKSVPVKRALLPVEKSNVDLGTSPRVQIQKRQAKTDIDSEDSQLSNDDKKRLLRNRTISRSSQEGFTSRFANEFEVKKVIGYGGFGIVFRAQSITDMNEYAVKRIAVADNDKARNRVLREARALAMFDHPGIIRYFYAWEERPPKGYQDKEDEAFLGKMKAEKLAKLHEIQKQKKKLSSHAHHVKSADTMSFAEHFEMPPVVGHTEDTENSWDASTKPQEVDANRSTSESKRGLYGESDNTPSEKRTTFSDDEEGPSTSANKPKAKKNPLFDSDSEDEVTEDEFSESSGPAKNPKSMKKKRIVFSNPDDESDEESSSSSSSSGSDASFQEPVYSSSGGIVFGDGSNEEIKEAQMEIAVIDEQLSIHNRAMIDETENEELEVRQRNDTGDCAYLYIVMQLCAEKTLEDWIRRSKTIESRSLVVMKSWIKQLASGLEYLHEKGYIHRDLKPGNVFFSLDSKPGHQILKIGDLGLATKTDGAPKATLRQDSDSSIKHTKNVGTRSYMSPEQINHQLYTEKVDIFALGLVAAELIIPFSTASERIHTFGSFQKGEVPAILDSCPESRDFLLQLTSLDPSNRPSASELANHPFLQ
ncbi:unnamed protein product [Caenorhabditis nigoni]